MALYQCSWQWPGVEEPAQRWPRFARVALAADQAHPDMRRRLRAWYTYPGEWAGVLIIEAETPEQVRDLLMPFTGLMRFEVRTLIQVDYDASLKQFATMAGQA